MTRHPFDLLDVFAERPMEGNPLLVVRDADDVPEEQLAQLARRARLSETSFVQSPTSASASYRHRIWTVGGEIPFAGHPSVGTAVAVTLARGEDAAELVQETPSGLQSLSVRIHADGHGGHARLRQNPLVLGATVDAKDVLRAFGLDAATAHPTLPAQFATTGLDTLLLPLRSVADLGAARMDPAALRAALAPHSDPERLNCYLVAPLRADTWRARCLALDLAGWEDPATGSAAGPFGGWLAHHGGPARVTVLQGIEMGDPSRIDVDATDGVVISGQVLVRGQGWIEL